MAFSQDSYNISNQRIQEKYIKIDLLNFNFQTVDNIEGLCTSGSITIDANSDIRRQGTISLVVQDSTFDIKSGGKIWLDKYIKIYLGTISLSTGEIFWENMGIYLINAPTYQYNATTNSITFQCIDLMSKMTGLRNGNLEGLPHLIEEGSSIRTSLISTINLAGFTRYVIEDNPQTVPYEIKIDVGGTVFGIISALRDISPMYEVYFDVDGVFHYGVIPSKVSDPILVGNDILQENLLDESLNVDFEGVKNVIEVIGRTIDASYYGDTVTVSGNTINVTVTPTPSLTINKTISFVVPSAITNPKLNINGTGVKNVVQEDGKPVIMLADGYYVVKVGLNNTYTYMGEYQIKWTAKDNNPESPYYVLGTLGEIRKVLTGGVYLNITTESLARQRAEYELWLHTNMNNSVSITLVPINALDVNIKSSFAMRNGTETEQYIIKQITIDLNATGTQVVSMIKFYPLYPFPTEDPQDERFQ